MCPAVGITDRQKKNKTGSKECEGLRRMKSRGDTGKKEKEKDEIMGGQR